MQCGIDLILVQKRVLEESRGVDMKSVEWLITYPCQLSALMIILILFGKEDEEKGLEVICSIQTFFSLSEIISKYITLLYF